MIDVTFVLFVGVGALTFFAVTSFLNGRTAQAEADAARYQATLWKVAAINTAAEWVRREKGETASADFKAWAMQKPAEMLRDHLPAIALKHAARWPNSPKGAG